MGSAPEQTSIASFDEKKSFELQSHKENKILFTDSALYMQHTNELQQEMDQDSAKVIAPDVPLSALENEDIRHNSKGWAVVFSAFLVNFFCIGVIFQWGNYQQLYLKVYGNQIDTFRISFVGAIGPTTILSSSLLLPPLIRKIGYRRTMAIGAVLAPLGLLLASMATKLWHIYLSQGFLFGFGCGFLYAPCMGLPSQWFKRNRSLATGIAAAGVGVGSLVISPLTEKLFETVGYQNALRVQGAMGFGLLMLATALAFSKSAFGSSLPQQEQQQDQGIQQKLGYRDITNNKDFLILLFFCFTSYFGYFAPVFLAPQYTTYLGHSSADGAIMISTMAGVNIIARVANGILADRFGNINIMFICTLLAGLSASVLWQFTPNYGTYVAYCILNGATGGAFVGLTPVAVADIIGVENISQGLGLAYTITAFGSLLGPPLAGKLLQQFGWTAAIQYIGSSTLFSAIILFCLKMKRTGGKLFLKI